MFHYTIGEKIDVFEFDRKASRAVIIKDNKVLVLKSDNHEVKLPGGGVDNDETFIDALIREVKEETGYDVLSFSEFGVVDLFANSKTNNEKQFSMRSKYFLVEVNKQPSKTNFQGYEIEENFQPIWIELEETIDINERALNNNRNNDIAERELIVFKEIKERIFKELEVKSKVITICGSLKFKREMMNAAMKLELLGNVVLIPIFPLDDNFDEYTEEELNILGKMHKEKIKISDAILVINVGGYIGKSTKSEIEFATSLNKEIRYLENKEQ
ncbi:NUDIX hydrolase [Haploplasma axanthum]|uniref:RNA pyrophosphohydrolase n=1 Tax=Haploplasma axanthum TaxID=29552 RepID=A0A449BDR5_HAPAX|nr:NUDIX domain-containing protein [Haploplasma axanthum]VEU80572.1 RNA pyrophosphohydrolase [Haploplasma axanthum]